MADQQRRRQIWPKKEDGPEKTQPAALRRLRARQRQRGTVIAAGISYEWHKATFENDLAKLTTISGWSENRWYEPDPRGMTLLHIAVLRGHLEAVATLLGAGCPCRVRDARGWTPLDHAQVTGQRECAKLLIEREAKCNQVDDAGSCFGPDCRLQLRCDLSLNRWYFCNRTWQHTLNVAKVGSKIRVDHKSFSLIFDSSEDTLVYYDPSTNSSFEADVLSCEEDIDKVVDEQLRPAAAPVRRRLLFRYFYTARKCCCCRCCFPRDHNLRIAGYETNRYDAYFDVDPSGGHKLRSIGGYGPLKCTWVQYLGGYRADDNCQNKLFSLLKQSKTDTKNVVDQLFLDNVHNLDVKCWFSHANFPLKLWHLIPFLKKAKRLDPSVAKVKRFIEQYLVGDRIVSGRFPLRVQVPGSAGVRATAVVRTFKLLEDRDPRRDKIFDLPADCKHHTKCGLDNVLTRIRSAF